MKLAILKVLTKKEHQMVKGYQIAKGNIIYHEGDTCENIGIIVSGKVDIVSYSFEGKEILINSLKAGDIFGNNLLFSSSPIYKGDVIAKEKCVIAFINKENLIFLLQNNTEFLNIYLNIQSDFGKTLNARIQLLSFPNAEERLQYYASKNNNVIEFKNVTTLAATIGVQRETLSRLLTSLIERHLIKKEKGKITFIKKKRR
ncbi:MAG: Crp/Fnr family transcriptional regulator [Bacilli bacterium]|nr:Crp/Fnr family transcriptional regulator [Bacilli bacterium]